MNKAILSLSLLFICYWCSGQQNKSSLLWHITSPESKVSSFVFGTIHLINEEYFYMPDTMEQIVEKVDQVCFELNIGDPMEMMMGLITLGDKLFLPDGATIDEYLSEEEIALLDERIAGSDFPVQMIKKLKPFFISTLLMEGGSEETHSLSYEIEISAIAKKYNKEICGLESIGEQLALFDSIPIEDQVNELIYQLEDTSEEKPAIEVPMDTLIALYVSQDLERLDKLVRAQFNNSSISKISTNSILTNRNKNWLGSILTDMENNTSKLYAVGAGHLGGEEGLIQLLLDTGCQVEPIYFSWK